MPISIILKIQNHTMKYYYGRWKRCKQCHVVCDIIYNNKHYSLCGISKEATPEPLFINSDGDKSKNICTVCGKNYKNLSKTICVNLPENQTEK